MSKVFPPVDKYFLAVRDSVFNMHTEISKWGVDELETLWRAKFGSRGVLYLPEIVVQDCPKYARVAHTGEELFWLGVSLRLFYEKKLTRIDTHLLDEDGVQIQFTINEGTYGNR